METIVLKGDVKWPEISVAENGFMVSWQEKTKRPGAGDYDHCDSNPRSHIFTSDQEDEAFDFFVKLKKMEMGMPNVDKDAKKEEAEY